MQGERSPKIQAVLRCLAKLQLAKLTKSQSRPHTYLALITHLRLLLNIRVQLGNVRLLGVGLLAVGVGVALWE